MRRKVLVSIVVLAAIALTGAAEVPTMTPETPLVELDNLQQSPAVAYNSARDQYLVVWQNDWAGDSDIYGQRLDAAGNVLSLTVPGPQFRSSYS